MAVRFYGDFKNDIGQQYRVNIYDNDFVSASTEVTLGVPGFTLTYEGNNQEEFQPILPSRLNFTIYNQGDPFNTWLNNIVPMSEEGRFPIEVLTDPGTIAEAVFWRGMLLPEQVQLMDEPLPSAVALTASDDISQLKEVTYDQVSGITTSSTVAEQIVEMLKELRMSNLWGSSDVFLRYADDFIPDVYTGTNFLGSVGMYAPTIPGTTPLQYYTVYEVLRSLCITMNARLFQAEGIYYFLPINKYERRSIGGVDFADFHQYDKSATEVTWSLLERTTWISQQLLTTTSGALVKMAGNTIEFSRPTKRVMRTREIKGNEWLFQYNTNFTTLDSAANEIELADDDRTYFSGSTHLITLNYNIDIASVASDNNFINNHTVRADFTIKFGDQYYTDTGWSSVAGTKKVVIAQYYKSFGLETIGQLSVQVPELVDDEVGLDIDLNVEVLNGAGGSIVASLPTHSVLFLLRVYPGDGTEGIGDQIVFSSESSLSNQVVIEQDAVITGNAGITYAAGGSAIPFYSGAFYGLVGSDMTDWVSSLTSTSYTLHRLGVREILTYTQLPHRIGNGTFYIDSGYVWPYHLLRDGDDFVIHEMTFNANDSELTVERWELNRSTTNISFRTNDVKSNNPRDRYLPQSNTYADTIATNFDDLLTGSVPQFVAVQLIEHSSSSTYTIDIDDDNGFMYMNKYVDAATGFGIIYLPKVADNEGRLFRFKSDSTVSANKYYRIGVVTTEFNNGVRIDGNSYFQMDRSYDGIAVLCYDGQWYVIQRKQK